MLWTLRALLLVLFVSVYASAQSRTLALYAEPARGLDEESIMIMNGELQRLLGPAELHIVWKNLAERKAGENFELVVVSSFEGSCSPEAAPTLPLNKGSLADTSISNGHILPFFRVDCARIVRMLGPHFDAAVLGRALARVIAHEIYHIVAQTKDHQHTGVAKAIFSTHDLKASRFELDAWSVARMRTVTIAGKSDSFADEGRR